MWIVHVVGHADGETFVGPFPECADALRFSLVTLDTLPEFAGYTSSRSIVLSSPSSYTV